MFAEGRENRVAEKEEEELVERKNLVEITFPERRLGSTISECFLGNSRLASWIRHGPRSFVHIVAPPFVRPLGVGGFARAPWPARFTLSSFRFVPFHPSAPFTSLPLPCFVSRIFTIFSQSSPIVSLSSSSFCLSFFSSFLSLRRLTHSSIVI